jgi:hypothetical protein
MKSVVVFESMYGNTHAIAEQIAAGLESIGTVVLGNPTQVAATTTADADLVVVGGPTHVHGMTSSASRRAAADTAAKDPDVDLDPDLDADGLSVGLRDWFDDLPDGRGRVGAAFDTRLDKPAVFTGSAAKGIAKRLKRHHLDAFADPESFLVGDTAGPLLPGEAERARQWGEELARRLQTRSGPIRTR